MIAPRTTRRRPLTVREMERELRRAAGLLRTARHYDASAALEVAADFVLDRGTSLGAEWLSQLVDQAQHPASHRDGIWSTFARERRQRIALREQFQNGRDIEAEI